jgi:hypothetical protein
MHLICTPMLAEFYSCKKWMLHRLIRMPYILESTSGTSTLIFPSSAWELILIKDTTLLKDKEYIHSGYMDRCTIA